MNVANAVAHWGTFDMAQSYAMQSWLNKDNYVIDVGANIGGFTVPLAERVGPKGKVFAFEPFRILNQHLNANVALNGLKNVYLFQHGCGIEEKVVEVYHPDVESGLTVPSAMKLEAQYDEAEAIGQNLKYEERKESIRVRKLDNVLDELRELKILDRKIDFIKVDVEFMELDVVLGARKLFTVDRPKMWVENEPYFDRPVRNTTFVDTMSKKYGYVCKEAAELELLCLPYEEQHSQPAGFQKIMGKVSKVLSPWERHHSFGLGDDFASRLQGPLP